MRVPLFLAASTLTSFASAVGLASSKHPLGDHDVTGNAAGYRVQNYENVCNITGKITPKVFIISMVRL